MTNQATVIEHYVPRDQGRIYAREYPGAGPAFVLMHGLPDNLHIYDELIPFLVAAGRRVVAFDFLGFGASDKPPAATYGFEQQLGDLEAIAGALKLGKFVPVAHDSAGAAALNYALAHPDRVDSICMLNSVYADLPPVHWPELVELFATPGLSALTRAILQSPAQFGWLLGWQQQRFEAALPQHQKAHYLSVLGPLITDNFVKQPSSGRAFAEMTAEFFPEIARNVKRLPELSALDVPVKLIWGDADPYFTVALAEERRSHFKRASLAVVSAGHWLQVDEAEQVATLMLSPQAP